MKDHASILFLVILTACVSVPRDGGLANVQQRTRLDVQAIADA